MAALNTVFKQVFGEGLKEDGFVKIKGGQPYLVSLICIFLSMIRKRMLLFRQIVLPMKDYCILRAITMMTSKKNLLKYLLMKLSGLKWG